MRSIALVALALAAAAPALAAPVAPVGTIQAPAPQGTAVAPQASAPQGTAVASQAPAPPQDLLSIIEAFLQSITQGAGKRQDVSSQGSEAFTMPSAEQITSWINIGTQAVNAIGHVADFAEQIKNKIQGKREELLARGIDVDDPAVHEALVQILSHEVSKRQETGINGSEAFTFPSAETIKTAIDIGGKAIGLFDGVANLAGKIKDMVTGKREELLARGINVDDPAVHEALVQILSHAVSKRQDTGLIGSEAFAWPSAETINTAIDIGGKAIGLFDGVANLAGKIKDMVTGKREELLARGEDFDGVALGKAFAESLSAVVKQQRRTPFVIPEGQTYPITLPNLGAYGFHALARSLAELD